MMTKELIRCTRCNSLFLKTPFDREPEYDLPSSFQADAIRSLDRDDFNDFMKAHEGHRLEELSIHEDSSISDKDYIEPVKVSYFRATNGKEKFVVKKFREKIGEPLRYEVMAADYSLKCVSLAVEAKAIEKQLVCEFEDKPFSKGQIDSFIRLYDHIVRTVDVRNLERVPDESSRPLTVYYKMDDATLMYLLKNCHHIFKGEQYRQVEEFIHRNKDDGVLLLRATYKIDITEQAKAEKESFPHPLVPENEKSENQTLHPAPGSPPSASLTLPRALPPDPRR
jgi:hypothetical protein